MYLAIVNAGHKSFVLPNLKRGVTVWYGRDALLTL